MHRQPVSGGLPVIEIDENLMADQGLSSPSHPDKA